MVIIQIGDYVLEEDIDLLLVCLGEYIKNIDGEEFKKIFLGYVEYMAIMVKIVLLMNMIK